MNSWFLLPPSGYISVATHKQGPTQGLLGRKRLKPGVNHPQVGAMQGLANSSNSGGLPHFLLAWSSQLWAYIQVLASLNNSCCPNNLTRLLGQTHDSAIHRSHWPIPSSLLAWEYISGLPGGSDGKESICNAEDLDSIPGLERSPGREWQLTPVFLPGEFQGQRSLASYSHGVTKRQI